MKKICDYGCNQKATHQFKNGKWCCYNDHRKCPSFIEKVRKNTTGKKRSNDFRKSVSKRMMGEKNHMFGTGGYWEGKKRSKEDVKKFSISHKVGIEYYENTYPFFSKIEEMRYNPYKLSEEKEIQVHCKNHDCENSKDHGGWFTPTYIQLYERIRQLEKDYGNGGCYFYCSDKCKNECILYGLKNDPFNNTELLYTQEEYNIWKQVVLEQDNHECQKCNSKENLHCHHIHPVKTHPHLALDPTNGIVLCKDCHYEIGHKTGTECSTGNLSNITQNGCKLGNHM